jgi:hypothetical protein
MASASSARIGRIEAGAVSPAHAGLVVASYRGGSTYAPGYETVVIVSAIAVMAVACVLIFRHLRRRYRESTPVADQWQALAVMGELCPHGWQAQITLYGWGAPVPADAPPSRVPPVELEWKQFDDEFGRVTVVRRVWAPTIGGALQTMVDDRRTDVTLEQIEQAAAEDGDVWWIE